MTILEQRFDISKAVSELKWKPRVSLEEGIQKAVEWYINSYLLDR